MRTLDATASPVHSAHSLPADPFDLAASCMIEDQLRKDQGWPALPAPWLLGCDYCSNNLRHDARKMLSRDMSRAELDRYDMWLGGYVRRGCGNYRICSPDWTRQSG